MTTNKIVIHGLIVAIPRMIGHFILPIASYYNEPATQIVSLCITLWATFYLTKSLFTFVVQTWGGANETTAVILAVSVSVLLSLGWGVNLDAAAIVTLLFLLFASSGGVSATARKLY